MPVNANVPQQMFNHALDHLKGWPSPHAVDIVGQLDPSTDSSALPVTSGRVVHVGANTPVSGGAGKVNSTFKLGAIGSHPGIFLIPGADDFDVANPGGGQTDPYGWTPVAPTGNLSGLVSTGAFELQSTECDFGTGVTYSPGDLLHSPTEAQITGADKSKAGVIFNARNWPGGNNGAVTQFVDNVIGVVSRGAVVNHNRRKVVSFWPYFLPGQDATH